MGDRDARILERAATARRTADEFLGVATERQNLAKLTIAQRQMLQKARTVLAETWETPGAATTALGAAKSALQPLVDAIALAKKPKKQRHVGRGPNDPRPEVLVDPSGGRIGSAHAELAGALADIAALNKGR